MLELYIFNKESPAKNGLTYWDQDSKQVLKNNLVFNLDRFKIKDGNDHLLTEFAQELNYLYKESSELKAFFEKLNGKSIELEFRDNFHHLIIYDAEAELLICDSKIQSKF